jgi:hypothetical protein
MMLRRGGGTRENVPRGERRFAVRLAASLATDRGAMPVRLLDLSVGGALAEAADCPVPGSPVTLRRERLEVAARVAWRRGDRFGLIFDPRIRATDLFVQLSRSRDAARAQTAPPAAPL